MAFLWMQGLIAEKKYGYQLLIKEYGKDRDQAGQIPREGSHPPPLLRAPVSEVRPQHFSPAFRPDLCPWHPAYDAFCRLREPYVITMENLRGITGAEAVEDRVYVVENEMVFSYLLDDRTHVP